MDDPTAAPERPTDDEHVGHRDLAAWPTAAGRRVAGWAAHLAAWVQPHGVALLTLAVGIAVFALCTWGAEEVYDQVSDADGLAGLDHPVLEAAMALRTPGLTRAVQVYTNLGGPVGMPVLATVVLVLLAWRWRAWDPVLLGLATAAGSLAMTVVGKAVVGRVRPPLADAVPPYEQSFSFPSGHSLNALALAGITAYVVVRRLRTRWARVTTVVLAAAFGVTMGLTRVYLGHHWLTDVVVAWVLALGWLSVVITAHRLFLTTRRRQPAPAAA
ncbi:MAG: phosphatase PAP2 family protein [Angustibacter sp.]